ncbi:hypothetical protein F5Y15DRAFT_376763 [Xylariaceae sp. FL0016]|nr:hypothetical protein F5Y15DRAFT_376763 [Xylariaceae sp. FL0016]
MVVIFLCSFIFIRLVHSTPLDSIGEYEAHPTHFGPGSNNISSIMGYKASLRLSPFASQLNLKHNNVMQREAAGTNSKFFSMIPLYAAFGVLLAISMMLLALLLRKRGTTRKQASRIQHQEPELEGGHVIPRHELPALSIQELSAYEGPKELPHTLESLPHELPAQLWAMSMR